jgi:L-threonylcarbamoyladenylate synthase
VNTSAPINIIYAARALERGELVAFPTETVYGLGADAENAEAVAKIFALKGRPQDHPVIVHIASDANLSHWAQHQGLEHWAREVPPFAYALMDAFWPGPLTLVLNKQAGIADACTGGQGTIGLRCPSHPVALALLREFKQGRGGIAAPSANKFGKVSPTTAQHVRESFESLDGTLTILDGGACEVGIESTIIDCSRPALGAVLLRPGMVSVNALRRVLTDTPLVLQQTQKEADTPRVSGDLAAHYQPDTLVRLVSDASYYARSKHDTNKSKTALIALNPSAKNAEVAAVVRALGSDPSAYAHALYATLRELDALGLDEILIERPPETPEWLAIHDRLNRAAYR